MHFESYPFDVHTCSLLLMNLADTPAFQQNYATLEIRELPLKTNKVLQYEVSFRHLEDGQRKSMAFDFENFPRTFAGFNIEFKRKLYPAILNLYLPTFIIVVISLMSFLIHPDSAPARSGLLITCLLVLVNSSSKCDHPGVNTFTALDFWMFACKFTVTVAIAEYAYLLKFRRDNRIRTSATIMAMYANEDDVSQMATPSASRISKFLRKTPAAQTSSSSNNNDGSSSSTASHVDRLCDRIDRICRVAILVCYVIFCTVYLVYFLAF